MGSTLFKIVRQPLFNADGDVGSAGGNESSATSSSEGFTPGWGLPQGNQAAGNNPLFSEPPQPTPPAPAPEPPQVFDFAGRKVEVADPSIAAALKDVYKDYKELTSTYQSTNQRMKELEQEKQTYLNLLQNAQPQQAPQPQAQPPQPSQPSPEELEQMKSEFMEKFYDNPLAAVEERARQIVESLFQEKVQPVIEPITQERQWNAQMQDLARKYPGEFPNMIEPMRQLLDEMPDLAQHGLETVFQIAKRATPPPAPQPEQLLNDPQFIEKALQNPEIQKQFLTQYMQEKQQSQAQAPTLMGGQPGGQAPFIPETRPTNIREGSKAFRKFLGL